MNSCVSSLQIHQTYEFNYFTKFIMWIQLIIILCVNSCYKGIHLLPQFFFQTHMMPMMEPAPNKATTMYKIGYKKTKCNDFVYKAKFKKINWRRSWRMKIQIMNPIALRPKTLIMKQM
jgi:hypothetical protein